VVTITRARIVGAALGLAVLALAPAAAVAHCDGLDGPVVKAAQRALETGNPAHALIWVSEREEAEARAAFEQARAVRALGPQARALADRFFFETLVRLHRAGEGEPYTGLKPARRDLGPAIPAADEAIRVGSVDPLLRVLTAALDHRIRADFGRAVAAGRFAPDDLAAGRAYVKAYVEFLHAVERVYESATSTAHGHVDDGPARPDPH
jgi:hypothetical protein